MAITAITAGTHGTLSGISYEDDVIVLGSGTKTSVGTGSNTIAADNWIYLDASGSILGYGTDADVATNDTDQSNPVARIQLKTALVDNAETWSYDKVVIIKPSTKVKVDNEDVDDVKGTDGADDITLTDYKANANLTLSTGYDEITLVKADQSVTIADTAGNAHDKHITYGNAKVTLGANSDIHGSKWTTGEASSDELTLDGSTTNGVTLAAGTKFDAGKFTISGGKADGDNKASIAITGGAEVTNSISKINSGGLTVSVEDGSYVDGALTAGDDSQLVKLTKSAANTFGSAADSSVVIKAGEIGADGLTLDMSIANTGAADDIEINTLAGNVTHTISNAGAKINITDTTAVGTYNAGNADNKIGIKLGAVNLESELETGELKLTAADESTGGKIWSFNGQTGKVVAATGSQTEEKDNITLAGTMAGLTLTTGEEADNIVLTKDLDGGDGDGVAIDAGKGDDIFNLSGRDDNKTSNNIVVNYSQGETSTQGGENGFDGIIVGDSVDIGKMSWSSGKNLVVKGVEFVLGDDKYVKFGFNSDEGTTWETYKADAASNTLVLVTDDSQDDDDDGTEHYDTTDASKTSDVDKTSGTVEQDEDFNGAETVDDDTIKNANKTFADVEDENTRKFVELDKQNWAATGKDLNMGSVGTSYVVVAADSAANGSIKMGGTKTTENNIVLKDAGTADFSKVTFKDYKSTKDVLIAPIALNDYKEASADDANKFINFTDGTYGKDVVASAGTLGANSVKGGLYAAKFRQSRLDDTGAIAEVDNEVMVVAGAASAASGDFSSASTQIFAMTVNNEDISDSVIGSKYEDVFVAGKNDVIDGGKGNDTIFTGGEAVTVALATGKETDKDIINGWKSNKGTIQLAKGKDFSNISVETYTTDTDETDGEGKGFMTFADGSGANAQATLNFNSSAKATLENNVLVKVNDGDGNSKTAMVFDGKAGAGVTGLNADSVAAANLFVGSGKGENLLDFSGTGKGNIFLGHSDGKDAEFGDTAQYVNVNNVKSDSVGGAWVFGGGSNQVTLAAGGDSDSLWGGGKKADTLISNDTYRTVFGTTNGAGVDVVQGFKFGADAYGETTNTDVVYFVDGVDLSKMKVSDGKFIVGSSDKSAIAFDLDSVGGANTDEGALITYSLGLGGPKYVAKADVTKDTAANAEITFTEDAMLYLGRGDKTTLVFNANNGNPTRFGFDSKYSGYKVGTLDGREAVEGSLINGSTDRAQKVYASEAGASSIAGGFGEGFVDGNSDTLIGGGDSEFGTTFFVGKDMGSDLIQNVSDGDTVVFLNTKVSDITNNINSDTYGKNVSVVFNSGSRVTATSTNNIADIEGLTVKFDDGTFTYDGVSKSWVRANA